MRTVDETANLVDRHPAPLAPGCAGLRAGGMLARPAAGEAGACAA